MHWNKHRPSPALVISLIALVVALGGTSYAAFRVPKNSVGAKQLKKSAVTTKKIKNGAVTKAKLNLNGVTAPSALHAFAADRAASADTATSAQHATSADTAGSADPVAFAHVSSDAVMDPDNSKNVGSVTPGGLGAAGYYCISGVPFEPRGGQATVDYAGASTTGREYAQFALGATGGCPQGTQAFVSTLRYNSISAAPFFVVLYR